MSDNEYGVRVSPDCVDWEPRPVIYTADGQAFRRRAGFTPPVVATQTRGTNPSIYTNIKTKPPKKKGK